MDCGVNLIYTLTHMRMSGEVFCRPKCETSQAVCLRSFLC